MSKYDQFFNRGDFQYRWSPRPYFYLGSWYIKRTIYRKRKFLWFDVWEKVETKYFGPFESKYEVLTAIEHA